MRWLFGLSTKRWFRFYFCLSNFLTATARHCIEVWKLFAVHCCTHVRKYADENNNIQRVYNFFYIIIHSFCTNDRVSILFWSYSCATSRRWLMDSPTHPIGYIWEEKQVSHKVRHIQNSREIWQKCQSPPSLNSFLKHSWNISYFPQEK